MKAVWTVLCVALLIVLPAGRLWARAMETVGNRPLSERNYSAVPGVVPLVNHTSRVYHIWVNGDERFFYRGDTATVNDILQKFAATEADKHEVVLRPGPGVVKSFNETAIPFNCSFHMINGIARVQTEAAQGEKIWSKTPVVTVFAGELIQLDQLQIPKDVTVVQLADLKHRYIRALSSADSMVRGWGAGVLAGIDTFDVDSVKTVAGLLKDEDKWVRQNAAGALSVFGRKAESAIPALEEARKTADEQLKTAIDKTINEIRNAKEFADAEKEHQAIVREIEEFCKSLPGR